MAERVHTGGSKSFQYSKKDLQRIRGRDTKSTREFKHALKHWQVKKAAQRRKKKSLLSVLFWLAVVAAIAYGVYRFVMV